MSDAEMEVDDAPTAPPPANAMAALMAGAKAKGKERATENVDAVMGMSEEELRALNEREGLPWSDTVQTIICHTFS